MKCCEYGPMLSNYLSSFGRAFGNNKRKIRKTIKYLSICQNIDNVNRPYFTTGIIILGIINYLKLTGLKQIKEEVVS